MGKGLAQKEEQEAREARLREAITNDNVAEVHNLIREERELLDRVSKHPFPDTPLHLAAEAGKTHVAMEMAILKPSFARKLNPEGYSPMHLALQHRHYQTVRALVTLNPELIRVRGRGGITPLHFVAGEKGDNEKELLAEFLCACKSSIEDLTSQSETAVHVAVKNRNLAAFKVLFGWLKRVNLIEILAWKDEDGNTVFNIAESEQRQVEILQLLTGIGRTKIKVALKIIEWIKNKLRRVARAGRPPPGNFALSQFLSRELTIFEACRVLFGLRYESARNIILVVATLITTATYQAALTPPGGYWQDNSSSRDTNFGEEPHNAGEIIMSGSRLYKFSALNGAIFLVSIVTIWITAVPLFPHTLPVYLLIWFLGIAYFSTAEIGFPKSKYIAAHLIQDFYLGLLLVVLIVPLFSWMNYINYRLQLFQAAPGRRVGNFLGLKDRK